MKKITMMRIVSTLSACLLVMISSTVMAQFTETKEVTKYQPFDPQGVLSVENKYGNVTIRSWNADSLRVQAKIRISSKSRDRLATMLKRSQVSTYITRNFADIKTVVDEPTLAKEWRNLKSLAGSGGDQIEVNYVIDVPRNAKLELTNRFGNTYIHKHDGRINIDSEHGDVRLGTTPQLERAEVSFGKLFAKKVNKPELDLSVCDLDISQAQSLKIESKSSTLNLGLVQTVYIQSTRDKVRIKESGNVQLSGTLTKLEIGKLTGQLDVGMRYGKLWVQEIGREFTSLRIKPKHCTVYLNFASREKVATVIKGQEISIDYDQGMGKLEKSGYQYEGHLGSLPSEGKSLYISGEKSSFTIDFEKN